DDEDGDNTKSSFGVAAAYLDILYNFNLISLSSRSPFFGSDFQTATSISTSTPGLIDEAGAFQTSITSPLGRVCQIEIPNATCAPKDNEFLLLTIPLRATAQGVADFVGDPADFRTNGPLQPPSHDVLLFNPAAPVLLDQIRFENASLIVIGSGGLPNAVDNTYHLAANSINNVLNVLANDTEVTNPPLTITATGVVPGAPPLQGSVSIATGGTSILYTPRSNFVGTEQFTYTIKNNVGLTDQAVVTVQVGNSPKDINVRLEITDLSNRPISVIPAGSEFKVRTYVQDIRTSAPDPSRTGVFAVYYDLLYNSGFISTKTDPANRFGFGINFAAPYNSNGLSANNSFVNVIDEVGAFQSGSVPLGSAEFLLNDITFRANAPGVAEFVVDPADLSPFHDVLLFEPPAEVAIDRVNLGVASITVVGAGGEGEYTNPVNPNDVSGDGFVSARDVLMIINDLNANGSRQLFSLNTNAALGEGEDPKATVVTGYIDVNGDGYVSPADALSVINDVNRQGQFKANGEGSSVLLTNAVADVASPLRVPSSVPALVINTVQANSSDNGQVERDKATRPVPDTRIVDALFAWHSQTDTTTSRHDAYTSDAAAELVSEDLLDALADRDSDKI
ncbi:MAG: dockerin type I domain-containing protein, partial [Planctomycetota bacterium]